MQAATIETVNGYLRALPDTASEQILSFVGYLNYAYSQRADDAEPLADEKIAIEKYRRRCSPVTDWNLAREQI